MEVRTLIKLEDLSLEFNQLTGTYCTDPVLGLAFTFDTVWISHPCMSISSTTNSDGITYSGWAANGNFVAS